MRSFHATARLNLGEIIACIKKIIYIQAMFVAQNFY